MPTGSNACVHIQVWKSNEQEYYDQYVTGRQGVVSYGVLGVIGQNGWYTLEKELERWPALAGWRGLRDPEVKQHFNKTIYAFEPDWGGKEEDLYARTHMRARTHKGMCSSTHTGICASTCIVVCVRQNNHARTNTHSCTQDAKPQA